jgi:uncharacterized membrane protein HdeD (DUF308 family)
MAETIGRSLQKHVAGELWGWTLARGVIAIALAVCVAMWPLGALFAFTMVFAAFVFIDGIASIIAGFRSARQRERWGWLVFRGITGVLIGLLFVGMPLVTTAAYAYVSIALLALWSILAGLFEIGAAIRLRKDIEGEWMLGLSGLFTVVLGGAIIALVLPNPRATILSAAWLIAIYAWVAGVILVVQALRLRRLAK